jgi:hypothetical protein
MRIEIPRPPGAWIAAFCIVPCLSLTGCTTDTPEDGSDRQTASVAEQAAETDDPPSGPTFINLLPWGTVDFERGAFPSQGECNAFVRALPNYSGYTTPERCQPIEDPVYCTVWQDDEDAVAHIACVKGVGGCEIELRRHDLLAESGTRTIAERCEPYSLADAWERYQMSSPAASAPNTTATR